MKTRVWILMISGLLVTMGCAGPQHTPPSSQEGGAEPIVYSNISVSVRRNGETVSVRSVTSEEEIQLVQEIVFDRMIQSALWEGAEASRLKDCVALSFDWTADSQRQSYYQYESEGRPVLQTGETGMYAVMSDEAYEKLTRLANPSALRTITADEAAAMLTARIGEKDADTGNSFSFGYAGTVTIDGKDYYRFRISWLVDNSHLSYLTDYLVAADGSELKEYLPEEAGR